MAERKQFSGDREAAMDYLGVGRNMLAALKESMALNKLMVLSRSATIGDVVITVSSVFGQDNVTIDAPEQYGAALRSGVEQLSKAPGDAMLGTLFDTCRVNTSVTMTVTETVVVPPPPPVVPPPVVVPPPPVVVPPPPDPTLPPFPPYIPPVIDPSIPTSTSLNVNDGVGFSGSVTFTIVTRTLNGAPAPTPTPTLPSLYIGGVKQRTILGVVRDIPFVWNDVDGMRELGTFFGENAAGVTSISRNGNWVAGYSVSPPVGGAAYQGTTQKAARWSTDGGSGSGYRTSTAAPNGGTYYYISATGINSDGTTVAVNVATAPGFSQTAGKWDGGHNHSVTLGAASVDSISSTSFDGLVASNGTYTVDGGARQTFGGSDCIAQCVTRVRRATPTPPPAPAPTYTTTTTTLVFSG